MLPLLLFLALLTARPVPEPVPFETIAQGDQSAIETRREAVARTPAEGKSLWREHAPDQPAPPLDFTKTMVVAVFAGYRNTAGYTATITAIEREGSTIVVKWQEGKPARDVMLAQVLTFPFHIVKTARHDGAVVFRRLPDPK